MIPIVDQAGFDAIECNRCGQCCEIFVIGHKGPLELLLDALNIEAWQRYDENWEDKTYGPQDALMWLGQLTPTWSEKHGCYVYSCGHFSRDETGQGVCGIHEEKPSLCERMPYGKPVHQEEWQDCSWNVEIVDFEPVQGAP